MISMNAFIVICSMVFMRVSGQELSDLDNASDECKSLCTTKKIGSLISSLLGDQALPYGWTHVEQCGSDGDCIPMHDETFNSLIELFDPDIKELAKRALKFLEAEVGWCGYTLWAQCHDEANRILNGEDDKNGAPPSPDDQVTVDDTLPPTTGHVTVDEVPSPTAVQDEDDGWNDVELGDGKNETPSPTAKANALYPNLIGLISLIGAVILFA